MSGVNLCRLAWKMLEFIDKFDQYQELKAKIVSYDDVKNYIN